MAETQPAEVAERSRSYTWQDPAVTLAALTAIIGLDWLRAMAEGRLPGPPILQTLGGDEFAVLGEGSVALTLTPAEHHLNPIGTVHGGVIATLLDTVAACAVHSTLPAGIGYTSVDLSTRFIRPVTPATGQVRAEGSVLARGSRTATGEARLTDSGGRLLAHATSTCLLVPLAPARA